MGTATVLLSRIHCFNIVNFSGDDAFAGEVNSKSLFHGILVLLLRYCWIKLIRETWLQGSQFSHISVFFLIIWTSVPYLSKLSEILDDFFFPYRIYLASWPSSPVMATSAIASSLSTLPTQIQDYGESTWFVNQPLLQTCSMLFKKNGKKII